MKEQHQSHDEYLQRKKVYYEKIEKSLRKKEKMDKMRLEELREMNEKRNGSVTHNIKEIKYKQKEQTKYYDQRIRERDNKVQELKAVIREDIETKKELNLLRKAD